MNITTCLFTVLGGMATLGHPSETVRLNQLGYYQQEKKVAVVNAVKYVDFTILDARPRAIGYFQQTGYTASSWSDKSRTILDFSDITFFRKISSGWLTAIRWHSKVKGKVLSPFGRCRFEVFLLPTYGYAHRSDLCRSVEPSQPSR